MGRNGDGDGAVEEQGCSHLWPGVCFLGKVWNCCMFLYHPILLCALFYVYLTTTLNFFFLIKKTFLYIRLKKLKRCFLAGA
jgi:hypothetical protein